MQPGFNDPLADYAESYRLPASANAGLQLAGDGVVVPMVRHLAEAILTPPLAGRSARRPDRFQIRVQA